MWDFIITFGVGNLLNITKCVLCLTWRTPDTLKFFLMARYINPFTDTGFKKIFGQEQDKIILIGFLNALLENSVFHDKIIDIEYRDKEYPRDSESGRTLINDVHCITESGRHIILEMQQDPHENFEDRIFAYGCRAISDQVKRGDWDFKLDSVYMVSFTGFYVDSNDRRLKIDRLMCDVETGKLINDRLRIIFIQLPAFNKEEYECETDFEKWIYTLKNMQQLTHIPFAPRDKAFRRLSEVASEAALTPEELVSYRRDMKEYQVICSLERTRFKEGLLEGKIEASYAIARNMLNAGMDAKSVADLTGLALGEVDALSKNK